MKKIRERNDLLCVKNERGKEREITFYMWKIMNRMERELLIYSKGRRIRKTKNKGR